MAAAAIFQLFPAPEAENILGEYILKPFVYKEIKAKSPYTP
jgi:hypothetical protein